MKKLFNKAVAIFDWSQTPDGKKAVHRLVTAVLVVYTALHRAGV